MATQTVTLMFQQTKTQIATLVLDASIHEEHTTTVETTDSPVEQGVDVTDHLRKKPDQVRIEGFVTNHPFATGSYSETVIPNNANGQTTAAPFTFYSTSQWLPGRAEAAYRTLLDLAGSSQLLTVVTALRVYTNMALTSLSVPRDAKIGEAMHFTAVFKEIQIVENQTVQVARTQPNTKPNQNLGKQATQPVTKSVALQAAGKIQDILGTKGGFFQ